MSQTMMGREDGITNQVEERRRHMSARKEVCRLRGSPRVERSSRNMLPPAHFSDRVHWSGYISVANMQFLNLDAR